MKIKERAEALVKLGAHISSGSDPKMQEAIHRAETENPWFTASGIHMAMQAISDAFLREGKIMELARGYHLDDNIPPRNVGLVLAGNIPMVGFHDILCTFLTGHRALIKYAEKDRVLIRYLLSVLETIDPATKQYFEEVEKLKDYDAAIATGSNQTAVHFEWYFRHVPHIIRRNRNSVAVLTGQETDEALEALGSDIFSYFGLGCRNVSKLFVPENFDITSLFGRFDAFSDVMHHNKYKNNFDYNLALFLLNKEPFLHNEFFILKESDQIQSRIGVIHWQRYTKQDEVIKFIETHKDSIQCVVSEVALPGAKTVGFGRSQCPGILDFADDTDTIQFLLSL
jgi:hypothetical protein